MRRPSRWNERVRRALGDALGDETGSAALEFIVVGLLLLVPIVYLVVALGMIQHQTLGAEAGARHLARVVATAESPGDADARADDILATVVDEYGLDPTTLDVAVRCADAAGECPRAGATVVVTMTASVALPLVPPVLGLDRLARIPVEASTAQKVSRFWSDE